MRDWLRDTIAYWNERRKQLHREAQEAEDQGDPDRAARLWERAKMADNHYHSLYQNYHDYA